jgi:hypothetical protein
MRLEHARAVVGERGARFSLERLDEETIVDWTRANPTTPAPFNADVRDAFLAGLPAALAQATSAPELREATDPPPGAGVARTAQRQDVWDEEGRLHPADAPHVTLTLDPPQDAAKLCADWGIEPLAYSGDVHQHSWGLPPLNAGRWTLHARLRTRPPGPLPTQHIGPSPAYDIRTTGGEVTTLDITV